MLNIAKISFITVCVALVSSAPPTAAQEDLRITAQGDFAPPAKGGVRRWRVATTVAIAFLQAPDKRAEEMAVIQPGAILNNLGCVETSAEVWCKVRLLHGRQRGYVSAAHLETVPGPDGIVAKGINDSTKRAKRKQFDVTSDILCAQEQGEPLGPCQLGVAQSDGGDATAAVTFGNGFTRLLFFMHGEFISAAATMSGAGRDTSWQLVDDLHVIRADDQKFEIPDALLFGAK